MKEHNLLRVLQYFSFQSECIYLVSVYIQSFKKWLKFNLAAAD